MRRISGSPRADGDGALPAIGAAAKVARVRLRVLLLVAGAVLTIGCSPGVVTPTSGPAATATTSTASAPVATVTPSASAPPTSGAEPTQTAVLPTVEPTPGPTSIDVRPFLTSQVRVVNLADVVLSVTISAFDMESTEHELGTFDVQPHQIVTQAAAATRYRFEFALVGAAGAAAEACLIDIAEGEQVSFGLHPEGVIVITGGELPDPAEMLVATSSRCRAGADE